VQTGSDGKILALICCYGLETHVGELVAGLNSHLLLAEVTRILELNPGFADHFAGEHSLPPTLLLASLLREGYSVSTPRGTYRFFNITTLQAPPAQILAKLTTLAGTAMANALEKLERARVTWANQSGEVPPKPPWQAKVMT
jgi:arginine utilization protein RocB